MQLLLKRKDLFVLLTVWKLFCLRVGRDGHDRIREVTDTGMCM